MFMYVVSNLITDINAEFKLFVQSYPLTTNSKRGGFNVIITFANVQIASTITWLFSSFPFWLSWLSGIREFNQLISVRGQANCKCVIYRGIYFENYYHSCCCVAHDENFPLSVLLASSFKLLMSRIIMKSCTVDNRFYPQSRKNINHYGLLQVFANYL